MLEWKVSLAYVLVEVQYRNELYTNYMIPIRYIDIGL